MRPPQYSLKCLTGKTWGIEEIQNIASTSKTHSSHIFQAKHKFSNDSLDLDLSLNVNRMSDSAILLNGQDTGILLYRQDTGILLYRQDTGILLYYIRTAKELALICHRLSLPPSSRQPRPSPESRAALFSKFSHG